MLKLFGKEALKEEQKTILMSLLNGRDGVAVLPTCSGKSLRELGDNDTGKVLVVSPLTALMQDQITTLNRIADLKALCLGKVFCGAFMAIFPKL